jgi:hypothetical protein
MANYLFSEVNDVACPRDSKEWFFINHRIAFDRSDCHVDAQHFNSLSFL